MVESLPVEVAGLDQEEEALAEMQGERSSSLPQLELSLGVSSPSARTPSMLRSLSQTGRRMHQRDLSSSEGRVSTKSHARQKRRHGRTDVGSQRDGVDLSEGHDPGTRH